MLRSIKEINGYKLVAEDGQIGRAKDFLFDDKIWIVRYMVADTGTWLPGRKVLVSPVALGNPDWSSHLFPVHLTKQQIKDAPALDEHAPVSRQYEKEYNEHFGWPYYWTGMYPGGGAFIPEKFLKRTNGTVNEEDLDDPTLRSAHEVMSYHIGATNGRIGHVEDFIVDDEAWLIRYMVVKTGAWLAGRKVLVASEWIDGVNWSEKTVHVDLLRESIEKSPPYDPAIPVNREYEVRLYDYYGRPKWWTEEVA